MQTQLLLLGQCKELAKLQQLGEEAVYLFVYQLLQLMRRTIFFTSFFHVDEIIMLLEYT
jgi:hypothetical protein